MRSVIPWLAALAAACGGERQLATPIIDTLPGGVIHVTNTGPTAWADTNGWRLVLERTIAPAPGEPGEFLDPRGIVADSRGQVFVLDRQPAVIKRFGPDGAFLGTIAGEGAGPGEISRQGVLMIARDTLVIHDQSQTRTSTWTTDGTFLRVWGSQCCMMMPMQADRTGRIPVPGMIYPVPEGGNFFDGVGFVRYRTDGTIVDSIAAPPVGPQGDVWQPGNDNVILIPLQPNDVSRLTQDGLVVAGHQGSYRLFVSTTGRDTVRFFDGIPTAVPIPDSIRQATLDQVLEAMPMLGSVARLEDLPAMFAPWSDVVTDDAGNFWVLVPGPAGEGDHWQVFDPAGILLGDVPAPFPSTYRTFWADGRVYAVVDNEATGLPEVLVYRIERGG